MDNYTVQFLSVSDFPRCFCFFISRSIMLWSIDPFSMTLTFVSWCIVESLSIWSIAVTWEHCVFVISDNVLHKMQLGQDDSKCSWGLSFSSGLQSFVLPVGYWERVLMSPGSVWSGRLVCFFLRTNRFWLMSFEIMILIIYKT